MPGPDCVLQLDKIMCDLTCTWTKRLVTWLLFGPNDLWLDLTWRLTKWLVTWLGLARKWLVTWLGLARKWLVTWRGLAKNDLLPSLVPIRLDEIKWEKSNTMVTMETTMVTMTIDNFRENRKLSAFTGYHGYQLSTSAIWYYLKCSSWGLSYELLQAQIDV